MPVYPEHARLIVPDAAPSAKRRIGEALGAVLHHMPLLGSYRKRLLATWTTPKERGKMDDFLFRALVAHWFSRVYLTETDPDRRDDMKSALMGGHSALVWAEHYAEYPINFEARQGSMTFAEACPLLPDMDGALAAAERPRTVVQVGASSGREIAWLATRHPRHRFIGTDIYEEVVAFCSRRHTLSNLSFERVSAQEFPARLNAWTGPLTIISSSSLQYVQPEHLATLFAALAARSGLELALLEPSYELHGDPLQLDASLWVGNLAYAHGYRVYAEKAGLKTLETRIIRPYAPREKYPTHWHASHYYYRGRTQ